MIRMAMPISIVLAVMAARDGWRDRLPWASWAVPLRAKMAASRPLKKRAMGVTSAGATRMRPTTNSAAPRPMRPNWCVDRANTARPIMTTPAQKPTPASRRSDTAPIAGRSASSGVTRPALMAGSSPASSVTPMPTAALPMTRAGETEGAPISTFIMLRMNVFSAPMPISPKA